MHNDVRHTKPTVMKKILFISLLIFLIPVATLAEETKEKGKLKKPERTILERNTNWTSSATVYTYAGEVEIRSLKDTAIFAYHKDDTNIFVIWYGPSSDIVSYAIISGKGCDGSSYICTNDPRCDTFFVTGLFTDTAYAGDKMLVGSHGENAFIACFLKNGTCLWARTSSSSGGAWGRRVFDDNRGNVTMVGVYEATEGEIIDFGDYYVTAYKTGTNSFDSMYRASDGTLIPDSKGIFVKKESK